MMGDASLTRRFAQAALWSVAAATLSRGFAFLATVGIGRVLGPTAYGQYALLQSTVGLFGLLAGSGFGLAA